MSYPASLPTRTVRGRFFTHPDGAPAAGAVRFVMDQIVQGPSADGFLAPINELVILDENGELEIVLPVSTDPRWTPFHYLVIGNINDKGLHDTLTISHLETGDVDLADELTLPPVALPDAYILLTTKGAANGVASLGSDGKVPASQLPAASGGAGVDWNDVENKPSSFPPESHNHAYSSLTGIPDSFVPAAHDHAIADIEELDEVLSEKANSAHTHAYSALTGTPETFAPSAHNHGWADVTGKPATYPPDLSDIEDLTVGGTLTVGDDIAIVDTLIFGPGEGEVRVYRQNPGQVRFQGAFDVAGELSLGGRAYMFQGAFVGNVGEAPADPSNGVVIFAIDNVVYLKTPSGTTIELGAADWPDITNKPLDYPPSDHFHDVEEITGLSPGGTMDWDDITGRPDYLVPRNAALQTWYAALANRHYSPAKIVVIGDSLSEGIGATQFGRGWVPMVLANLRHRFPTPGVVGGQGFVASWDNPGYGGGAPSYTYPVGQNAGFYSNVTGFSLKSNTLLATGDQMSYTFTGTSVHVWYVLQADGGTFSVTIDDVVVEASVVTAGTSGRGVWTSGALTPGEHTILVTRIAGGGANSVIFNGFRIFDGDETKGIQIFNCSQSGLTSGQFATNAANGDKWATWLNVIEPQLVIIELGLNDWTTSVSMATLKTNLKSIITTIRAQTTVDPSIVIYAATEANSGSYASTYAQLHAVWEEVVAEDADTVLLDMNSRIVAPHLDNSDGLYYDLLHPSDKGHSAIADRVVAFLSPQ